jgi:1,4-alpha-glucan branching enzyme
MLSKDQIELLREAHHPDPFAVLGLHTDEEGALWMRAMLPGAKAVAIVDAQSGKPVAPLERRHADGVFEAKLVRRKRRFDYRLAVQWSNNQSGEYADAYAFGSTLSPQDLHYLGEGTHQRPYTVMGAHLLTVDGVAGTRFVVWAPNAKRVSVVGDFNNWDGRRHCMRLHHGVGLWEIFIPHVAAGDRYKYEICGPKGKVLPLKADPYAFCGELRPDNASVIAALPAPKPLSANRSSANDLGAPVSIYEVHLGSWKRAQDGGFKDWDALAAELIPYVADLGFTHIELLPVSEHPFDGSWGYQTLGMFAPTRRFGDASGFERFVSACHKSGLGVIVDWVPAHFPTDAHGLAQFDGTHLYEYADPREGFHRDWNTLIYNFGRTEVRNFLAGSALFWLERYGIDGLRVDAVASMLYRDYSRPAGEWVPNIHGGRENLEAISLLRHINELVGAAAPGAITLAEESTAFPAVSRPTYVGGLGFHYKWNMGWMHDTLHYMHRDPAHRKYHHGEMTFGLVYAFSENFVLPLSHDEVVHGKGSLLNKMPGDRWQKFANLRAYFGFMWTHPGKKLLFMGGEFAQEREWNHDTSLQWELLQDASHRGVRDLVRDLNRLYRGLPALHRLDCEGAGFEWIEANDTDYSILAFLRKAGDQQVLVLCNFTPVPRVGYRVGIPFTGGTHWSEILNTDSEYYGGSNVGNGLAPVPVQSIAAHGRNHSLSLTLPPLATIVLQPV